MESPDHALERPAEPIPRRRSLIVSTHQLQCSLLMVTGLTGGNA